MESYVCIRKEIVYIKFRTTYASGIHCGSFNVSLMDKGELLYFPASFDIRCDKWLMKSENQCVYFQVLKTEETWGSLSSFHSWSYELAATQPWTLRWWQYMRGFWWRDKQEISLDFQWYHGANWAGIRNTSTDRCMSVK